MKPKPSYTARWLNGSGAEEAVDVAGTQVGHHVGRRHVRAVARPCPDRGRARPGSSAAGSCASSNRTARPNFMPFQSLGSRLSLCLMCMRDGLAVDVLDRRHDRPACAAEPRPMRHRQRHRRQHVRGVVLLVQRLVAHHRPAGGLLQADVRPFALVETHRVGHDDRRGAGDGHEADLEVGLLQLALFGGHRLGCAHREQRRDRGHRRARTDGAQEVAARLVVAGTGRASPPIRPRATRGHPRCAYRHRGRSGCGGDRSCSLRGAVSSRGQTDYQSRT